MRNRFPCGWQKCMLKDIGNIVTGATPNSKHPEYYGKAYPFYKPTDLNAGYFVETSNNMISEKGYEISRKLPAKSILVTCIGATIGKTGLIRCKGICNQQINAIIPYKQIIPEYVYFYIISNDIQYQIKKNASATTLPILNKSAFEKLKFLLPPLNEQRRIVEKIEEEFGKIDEGVGKLRFALEQIKQYRQAVLKSAFDGKLYKTTEWKEKTLGQILTPRRERIIPNKHNGELPFIGMDCIMPNSLKIHNSYKLKDTKSVAFVFYKNDVLYGRMRSYLNKVWQATFDGASSAEFIVFPENKQITSGFLKYLLHQQTFVKYATRNASGDRPRVKFEADLAEYKIKLPKIDEQNLIVEKIENAFSIVEDLNKIIRQNIDKAEQLKQSILKKAFEGRLVPQDPNDEPASVLLEKIKAERKNKCLIS